jgi:hypothetical protein
MLPKLSWKYRARGRDRKWRIRYDGRVATQNSKGEECKIQNAKFKKKNRGGLSFVE